MQYLIIGGNAAGMSAASRLRKNNPHDQITVLEKGDIVSFGACGLPYFVGDEFNNPDEMIARSVEAFQKSNIEILLQHEAVSLDPHTKIVTAFNHLTQEKKTFSYDRLIISTGAYPIMPEIEGNDLQGVFTLTTMNDGIRLKEALRSAKRAVVIGAGFIGLEIAEAIRHQEKMVTIIERESRVLPVGFDREMTQHLEEEIQSSGVQLQLEETVISFKGNEHIQQVITNKGSYNADLVIVATGFRPATKWCQNIGLKMLPNGAIIINEFGETSLPDIYAGGDCATIRHAVSQKDVYLPFATTANKLGRLLGDNIMDKKRPFQGTLGSSALRFMNFEMARTGLSEKEAELAGFEVGINVIQDYDHTSYVPNRSQLFIKLIYDKKTRILLGGQMCGQKGAVLRVDVLAAGIFKKMTVDELGMLDLVYAPPFARTWDALNIAGNTSK